ncbi:SLC13 family permease [Haliea sp.]|jgi:di/tricarboxylate transporter|uniref:SLC13 family permease n=1 Tax=Haliea TaxID=475794 RepID=UPI000C367D67|nr:SLC13 family permease [Haliea sp.]HCD53868.1 SLC13 family permease [Halieaceae bacterium]MAD64204.1 SLC13 family permease [Haliea sp.]MAY94862.1 SLC13 family permease [Haliea sp.]MBK39835.1 SLC13 family permease [Haliea sp.]MBP69062.1 SLC13 family permease [Haliea sp.]|tara:strand:- start:2159 stop:4060 length:1902 start_codon:yes stop_codon:yes gene_type:complete
MTIDQGLILLILVASVAMFLWGRWRHDMVALGTLLACVLAGLVAPDAAFSGFGHPAVITVACVLVLSRGLQASGAVDVLARRALPANAGPLGSLAALVGLGALLSGFMNNVGAMALLMPVALQIARRHNLPPGRALMPLAFGTILGGMTTMIGTPPNLIVAGFRAEAGGSAFGMFDFTPVGLAVALCGLAFVVLLGGRLVPARKQEAAGDFDTGAYLTEARITEGSKAVGMSLRELEAALDDAGAQVVGLVRNEVRLRTPYGGRQIRGHDILVLETSADTLGEVLSRFDLKLVESVKPEATVEDKNEDDSEQTTPPAEAAQPEAETEQTTAADARDADEEEDEQTEKREEAVLTELAVLPGAALAGRSASDIQLRTRYGLNLLAVSREGHRSRSRLRALPLRAGDLLLIQGPTNATLEFASDFSCVPLAERDLRIPSPRKAVMAAIIMAVAVGGAAFGLLPAAVSFALGVLASMALRTVPPRNVYTAIDWPVIVLLAALIPVAGAMATTGTADLIARFLLTTVAQGNAVLVLGIILVTTMFLSDLMNNAATAAVMCPIALGTAAALGVDPDSFLMAVAIGASCAFLTPIGHQNNTLILGPGGFHFGDYWRLGLPLEALVVAVSLPLLLIIWPL